jgi:photosystem I P700 chlorophyll a apoprotein A2
MGSVHSSDLLSSNVQILACHWGHLAVIFIWLSSNLFHVGFAGNYEVYCCNPIKTLGIAHTISDPHFSEWDTYVLSTASIYNLLYTSGLVSTSQLYNFVILLELIAICSIILAKMRVRSLTFGGSDGYYSYTRTVSARLLLLSGLSILWFGHLEAVAIPFSRGLSYGAFSLESIVEPFQDAWGTFLSAKWYLYGKFIDAPAHIAGSSLGAGRASLTFLGGLEPITGSLFIGDQAHHHLAIGLVFLLLAEVYFLTPLSVNTSSNYARSESSGHVPSGPALRLGAESVGKAGGGLAVFTSGTAQDIHSITPYYYLSYDYCA